MALNGRAGHRFSQAPQPIQRSMFMAGILGEEGVLASEATICMAPVGQWRAQLPHSTPSVRGTQLAFTHTAWPICMLDFSAKEVRWIASVGQTSAHFAHSGRQYPRSYDISGCMKVIRLPDGRNTWLGQLAMHNWQAVQCCAKCDAPSDPGGVIGVARLGIFLSSMTANPPSTFFSCACSMAVVANKPVSDRNVRREPVVPSFFASVRDWFGL